MCVGAPTRSYCDVLRKKDLDRAIRGRMTWQDKPQCDPAARVCARFNVVDHQSRLFIAVNIEPCPLAVHLDPDLRPFSRDEIDIRFVLTWCLLAEAEPRPVRMRDVLH